MGCWLVGGGEAVVVGSRRKERGGRGRGRKNDARDRSTTVMLLLFRDSLSLSPALLFLLHSLSLSLSLPPRLTRIVFSASKQKKRNKNLLTLATAGSANDAAAGPSLFLPLGPTAAPPAPPRASARGCPPASAPTACALGRASGAEASRQERSRGVSMRFFGVRVGFFSFDRFLFTSSFLLTPSTFFSSKAFFPLFPSNFNY